MKEKDDRYDPSGKTIGEAAVETLELLDKLPLSLFRGDDETKTTVAQLVLAFVTIARVQYPADQVMQAMLSLALMTTEKLAMEIINAQTRAEDFEAFQKERKEGRDAGNC